jgi:hypothetical protein
MRGAVLYKLGLDYVKDRVARFSYGVTYNAEFVAGHHPNNRKIACLDGVVRCSDVMDWYAKKAFIRWRPFLIIGRKVGQWSRA